MDKINPLDQVKLDADIIMRQRMEAQKESKAWQESIDGPVSLSDKPVAAVTQPEPVQAKTEKPEVKKTGVKKPVGVSGLSKDKKGKK